MALLFPAHPKYSPSLLGLGGEDSKQPSTSGVQKGKAAGEKKRGKKRLVTLEEVGGGGLLTESYKYGFHFWAAFFPSLLLLLYFIYLWLGAINNDIKVPYARNPRLLKCLVLSLE